MDFIQIIGSSQSRGQKPFSSKAASLAMGESPSSSQSGLGASALPRSLTPLISGLQKVPCAAHLIPAGAGCCGPGGAEERPPARTLLCQDHLPSLHFVPIGIGCHQPCSSAGSSLQFCYHGPCSLPPMTVSLQRAPCAGAGVLQQQGGLPCGWGLITHLTDLVGDFALSKFLLCPSA